jgi:FkbM family methyltransferase
MMGSLAYLLSHPDAWVALLSWPKFSATSFRMVSSLMRQGIVPRTVIDVGANVGQFAVACAKIFPGVTVHSFEPLPGCVERLKRNVARLGDVHVYPLALGAEGGEVTMHVNSHSHSSSILALGERHRRAFPGAREVDAIKVNISTLDLQMKSMSLERPVLLKLDVQGYEPQVLEGATETLNKVDYVLLEASFRPMYEGERTFMDIAKTMQDHGFEFLRPVDWLRDPHNGEVLQIDALFMKSGCRSQCAS